MVKKIVSGTVLTLLLISIVTLPCNIVKAEPRNVIATYGSGYLEDVDGVLVLHVKGSPYEMGYQNGYLLKDSIQAHTQFRIQEMIDMDYSYEYLVNCAQAMESHIPQEYIEEMQGLADGASMNYTDVLLGQTVPDIACYGTGWACSGFAVFGNATMDGHLYHGRNLDYSHPYWPTGLITVYEPENGNVFVNVGIFGVIGVHTGMNKEGITLQQNLVSTDDITLDGMPSVFMHRKVLQYSNNLTETIDIICQTDRTTGWNILLGDGKNLNAIAVEVSDNYCKVYWAGDPAEDVGSYYSIPNAVRRTNYYVGPTSYCDRYQKLSQLILDNYGNIDAEMSIDFLPTVGGSYQSVVFDSTDLELWVANAAFGTPASEQEFIYLSYSDLFSEYLVDLTISSTTGGNITTPGEGTFTYPYGTEVNLVSEPDEHYHFGNWTGNVSTIVSIDDATTTITMQDDYDITANFEADAPWGCFIATAAYGTPMAEEIEILRGFRDEYLLTNPVGQTLVGLYYRVSPPIAEFITEHPSLKPIVIGGLVPVVAMSTVVVNTTPAEKIVMAGLLVLVSAAVAIWATRRRQRGPGYSRE